jgi:hypothetical protein
VGVQKRKSPLAGGLSRLIHSIEPNGDAVGFEGWGVSNHTRNTTSSLNAWQADLSLCVAFGRLPHKVTILSKNTSLAVSSNKPFGGPQSKSGFPGVSFHKASGKWIALVSLATGKRKHVGLGATPAEAAALRAAFIAEHGIADLRVDAATVTSAEAA